ncbi:MAG TPA: hypothetical protein VKV26_17750 [Dehalococcoidia bacterium]|nr:hypothetical protein [Dehalococcoidia bacterium]
MPPLPATPTPAVSADLVVLALLSGAPAAGIRGVRAVSPDAASNTDTLAAAS